MRETGTLVCWATAQKEADEINDELGEEKAIAIPLGVDTKYFTYRESGKLENQIGFLGALNVAHNEDAVIHFSNDILPLILSEMPDAKFLVIGGGASDKLLQIANKSIIFTGRVDDVRDYLEKCKVFVCPMTFGSGIKTKNLEAMAMGLPVVTTSIGAENINADEENDLLVVDDNERFAALVLKILRNDKERIRIGQNGRNFVNQNFTWSVAKKKFELLLKEY